MWVRPRVLGKFNMHLVKIKAAKIRSQNGKIAYAIPVETHVQNDTVSPEPQKSGKEYVSVSADSEFNIDSQNDAIPAGTNANYTLSPEQQMSGKESVSISVNSEFNIDSQNGKTADANPVETQLKLMLGVGRVKSENVAADEKESVPSEPEFCIEAGSVGNVAQFITHNCEANLVVQCVGWAAH
ncbi:hypothetical protein Tco_0051917 [Tanacetum coccineum]